MQPSAEIRWFWPNNVPPRVRDWYFEAAVVGGGSLRRDEYLVGSGLTEIGIKRRDVRPGSPLRVIEIKGLVDVVEPGLDLGSGNAKMERWLKWTCPSIDFSADRSLNVDKTRWLRKFSICEQTVTEIPLNTGEKPIDTTVSLPLEGCNVELTKITLDRIAGTEWFTVGMEAFGELDSVVRNLRQVADLLNLRTLPGLTSEHQMNYPTWLRMLADR